MGGITPKHGLYQWESSDEMQETIQKISDNAKKIDDLLRFVGLGESAIIYDGSVYVKNDNNIFGYDNEGNKVNLATVQQNNLIMLGDWTGPMWIAAKDYVTVKAPAMSLVEEINPNGTNITPARTILHQGNSCFHALMQTDGSTTQSISKNEWGTINILANSLSQFPVNSVSDQTYTIPRNGLYSFVITAKISSALTVERSYLRFGIQRNGSYVDLSDMLMSSSYGTPFISLNYMYEFNKGDKISPAIKPLNEDITIGAGSKFFIYFQGDTITE